MTPKTHKTLMLALTAALAANLVALLAKSGTAQQAAQNPPGTFQAACAQQCIVINTTNGAVVARGIQAFPQ